MGLNKREYYIIFDTNVLFQRYDSKADFTVFSFNATYENVVNMINALDIYEYVTIVIPTVVWKEMEKQIIEKHDECLTAFRTTITKKKFPEFSIVETQMKDYSSYIKTEIENYKKDILSSTINSVIEMPLATNMRFDSIVNRAFDKKPPFEGKEKKSDKGFKDALLWESILEFAILHPSARFLYYSKDNIFGEFLSDEFLNSYNQATLNICKDETEVKDCLEEWAKEIDIYAYHPIENHEDNRGFMEWIESGDFLIQLIDMDFGLVDESRLIQDSTIRLVRYDNIQVISDSGDTIEYSADVILEIGYVLKGDVAIKDVISVKIDVNCFDNAIYTIEDIYRNEQEEIEVK